MDFDPERVLITGGNSAIARHLLKLLPGARAMARTANHTGVVAVGDYRRLGRKDFAGAEVVINCAGIVAGTEAELRAVNVDLQVGLATTARAAGVARYVAIGSFAIFGAPTSIDGNTLVAPLDAYGRSKRDGEQALQRLDTDTFGALSVAFPAIVGTTRAGKVERMLRTWARVGAWPIPRGDIARSMIGAAGAARVLACAAADDRRGRVLAADPVLFRFAAVARWLREETGDAFRRLPIPPGGEQLIRWVSPSVYRSLMMDSVLDPASNYMVERNVASSLQRELVDAISLGNPR